jgi:predicted RNA-binding Zn-ribbon protein involved in translation (DUF1610 family)
MKLLLLRCLQCAQPLTPDQQAVVVMACPNCGSAIAIREQGLSLLEARYAATREQQADRWPFWLFSGQVLLDKRETHGGKRSAAKDAQQFWGVPRRFYLPAWELEWQDIKKLGIELLQQQPAFRAIERPGDGRFRAATVEAGDAEKLIRLLVLTLEAARGDWLEDISFRLQLNAPELWAIPARLSNSGWELRAEVIKE